jgi:hypothetical protein
LAGQPNRGPVVVDTDDSARLIPDSALARRYEPLVAEVRYGALLRGWGEDARLRRMEAEIARTDTP